MAVTCAQSRRRLSNPRTECARSFPVHTIRLEGCALRSCRQCGRRPRAAGQLLSLRHGMPDGVLQYAAVRSPRPSRPPFSGGRARALLGGDPASARASPDTVVSAPATQNTGDRHVPASRGRQRLFCENRREPTARVTAEFFLDLAQVTHPGRPDTPPPRRLCEGDRIDPD